jgi:hypothetical protein
MNSIRKLWWVGAVAIIAACDPYDDENSGAPQILSVFSSNADEAVEATGDATAGYELTTASVCSPLVPAEDGDPEIPQHVDPVHPAIYVKFNKLLDGASIQASTQSCEPANGWLTVTRNGAPDTGWFSCYNPSSPTTSEGASVIFYRGADVSVGAAGDGWFAVATGAGSTTEFAEYVLTGNILDKQGNQIPINITYTVEPDAGPLGDVTVTAATGVITWEEAECLTGTASAATGGYRIYKQDEADADPVELGVVAAGITAFTDPAPATGRVYFIAPIIATTPPYETAPQGPFDESTNPAP